MAAQRGEILALLDNVLEQCGVWSRDALTKILNDDDGVNLFIESCRVAAAQAVVPPPCVDIAVQTEIETATVGTTTERGVATHDVASSATFSLTTGARMVSMEVQCSPPQMVQRAVQVVPAHVATRTRDAAVDGGVSWEDLKKAAMEVAQAKAREDVLREFEPSLERAVVAVEVKAEHAATMLAEAHEIKRCVNAGFENDQRSKGSSSSSSRQMRSSRGQGAAARDRDEHVGTIELLRFRLRAERHGASWS